MNVQLFVAWRPPCRQIGLKDVVVGEGDTYKDALSDVESAIRFHIETFGSDVFEEESPHHTM